MVRELTVDSFTNELVSCARLENHKCVLFCESIATLDEIYHTIKTKYDRESLIGVEDLFLVYPLAPDYKYALLTFQNGNTLTIKIFERLEFEKSYILGHSILLTAEVNKQCKAASLACDSDKLSEITEEWQDTEELLEFLSEFKINNK